MKKITALIISIVLCLTVLCACGRKTDSEGNTLITSNWKCVSFTVNGTHTDISEDPFIIKLFMSKDNPKFKCSDGENFTITLLQKSHSGKLTLNDDGTYLLTHDQGKDLYAKIEGNTLTIYSLEANMELVFETS